MWEWIADNTTALGAGIVATASIAVAAWKSLQAMRTEKAKTSADVAIAESQKEVYQQMNERMTSMDAHITRLQAEVDTLRTQLRERDNKIHSLEMYVSDLQHILQQHGIPVPPMK